MKYGYWNFLHAIAKFANKKTLEQAYTAALMQNNKTIISLLSTKLEERKLTEAQSAYYFSEAEESVSVSVSASHLAAASGSALAQDAYATTHDPTATGYKSGSALSPSSAK